MKYLSVLSILAVVLCIPSAHAQSSDTKLSTPEDTLNKYVEALKEGNLEKVLKCYYSDRSYFKFRLPAPIKIKKYIIEKKEDIY